MMAEKVTKITENTFQTLYSFDVTPFTKTINLGSREISYVPWSTAWRLVREMFPETKYWIWTDPTTNQPFFESKFGVLVGVTVEIGERKESDWYEVEPDSTGHITTFEITNAHQRALVKCLARHGFGLKLWEGLDQWRTKTPQVDRKITEAQAKRLYAIAFKNGHNETTVNGMLEGRGYKTATDISMKDYEEVVKSFQR